MGGEGMRLLPLLFSAAITLGLFACGADVTDPSEDPLRAWRAPLPERVDPSCLQLAPELLQLPAREVGCATRQSLDVINGCNVALNVLGIELEGATAPSMVLVQSPAIPLGGAVVEPGAVLRLGVRFLPDHEGTHQAALKVKLGSANGEVSRSWTLEGEATPERRITETFVIPEAPRADALVVIDNGPLLAPHLQSVRDNLNLFLTYVAHPEATSYRRLAFTTTTGSGGAGRADLLGPGVIEARAPSVKNDVAHLLSQLEAREGGGDPLAVLTDVLEKAGPAGPFSTLLDGSSELRIILITAGPDSSPGTFYEHLEAIRHRVPYGHSARWEWQLSVSVIGGFEPWIPRAGQCGFTLDDGLLARFAGDHGVRDSICEADWAKTLEWLDPTHHGFASHVLPLHEEPDLRRRPIEVRYDAHEVPGREGPNAFWWWDSVRGAVVTSPAFPPEPGQTVTVKYSPHCAP